MGNPGNIDNSVDHANTQSRRRYAKQKKMLPRCRSKRARTRHQMPSTFRRNRPEDALHQRHSACRSAAPSGSTRTGDARSCHAPVGFDRRRRLCPHRPAIRTSPLQRRERMAAAAPATGGAAISALTEGFPRGDGRAAAVSPGGPGRGAARRSDAPALRLVRGLPPRRRGDDLVRQLAVTSFRQLAVTQQVAMPAETEVRDAIFRQLEKRP